LGLGLALVKSLVALHGGSVAAWSAGPGKGSTFSFVLPRLTQSSGAGLQLAKPSESTPIVSKPLSLLIVDDNADAASMLALSLESAGHRVNIEHEPFAALDRARADPPDVCLLDIGLPGIDGNEFARRLRSMPSAARATLIAVTGYGHEHDREASIAAGFDYYFVKPANPAKLAELLADIRAR
jgi:CheY-like chemotaxis protein